MTGNYVRLENGKEYRPEKVVKETQYVLLLFSDHKTTCPWHQVEKVAETYDHNGKAELPEREES